MANTLILKFSTTAGLAPTNAQLSAGELALNQADVKGYVENGPGTAVYQVMERLVRVQLTADATGIGSVSLTNVPTLTLAVAANEHWKIYWFLYLTIATTTETFGVNLTAPTSAVGNYVVDSILGVPTAGAGTSKTAVNPYGTAVASTVYGNLGSATTPTILRVETALVNGANAGTMQLQLNGSTTGSIVVKSGSYMAAERLA